MKNKFSKSWKSSSQPRKQRKYRHNAPLHIKQKFMQCHLSKELRKKHNVRSLQLKKGDKVKICRGQFNGKSGKIEKIDLKKCKAIISGIDFHKKDGTKANYPINPTNLMITELDLEDKRRQKIIDRKGK